MNNFNKISKERQGELLFKYIKPDANDNLSKMAEDDFNNLLFYINNYYLKLRSTLGEKEQSSVTFGLEIECEYANVSRILNKITKSKLCSWIVKSDLSLQSGAEINSPILYDTISTWDELKKVCNILNQYAKIGSYSGGHIHIGAQFLGNKSSSWLNFIKLWSVYENVIYRFVYGNYLTPRLSMLCFARPIGEKFFDDYKVLSKLNDIDILTITNYVSQSRNQAVNFCNVCDPLKLKDGNTIEFRCPNGTFSPVIWQNNVNLFINMLKYSKSSGFDEDIVNKRHEETVLKYVKCRLNKEKLHLYQEIYLPQALELCDMIFSNNLDKIYFLRQYIKSFEVTDNIYEQVLAKRFIKKI